MKNEQLIKEIQQIALKKKPVISYSNYSKYLCQYNTHIKIEQTMNYDQSLTSRVVGRIRLLNSWKYVTFSVISTALLIFSISYSLDIVYAF